MTGKNSIFIKKNKYWFIEEGFGTDWEKWVIEVFMTEIGLCRVTLPLYFVPFIFCVHTEEIEI